MTSIVPDRPWGPIILERPVWAEIGAGAIPDSAKHSQDEFYPEFISLPSAAGNRTTTVTAVTIASAFEPSNLRPQRKTELARRLDEIRDKAIAAGLKLLSEEEILEEVRSRRGDSRF